MGLPVSLNSYRAQLLFSAQPGGRPWSTKFDYTNDDGLGDLEEFATEFTDFLDTEWGIAAAGLENFFNSSVVCEGIRIYSLTDPLFGVETTPAVPIEGGNASVTPAEVAVVASLRSAVLGRSGRGRQYWGGLSTQAVSTTTGEISPTMAANMTTWLNRMRDFTGTSGAVYEHVIISTAGSVGTRPAGTPRKVTNVLVDRFPDTQRRRGAR